MRRAVAALAGVGLLVLAGAVALTAPDDATQQSPFAARAVVGSTAQGRTLSTEVTAVRLARIASTGAWTGETHGVWVVAESRVTSKLAPAALSARLRIGGVEYEPSARPGDAALDDVSLDAGLTTAGAFFFEVPRNAVTGAAAKSAVIRIQLGADPLLDSVTDTRVDLTRLTVRATLAVDPPGLAEG